MATEMTVQNGESSLGGENEATTSPNADRSDETFNNSTEELVQVYLTTAALGCVTKKSKWIFQVTFQRACAMMHCSVRSWPYKMSKECSGNYLLS